MVGIIEGATTNANINYIAENKCNPMLKSKYQGISTFGCQRPERKGDEERAHKTLKVSVVQK